MSIGGVLTGDKLLTAAFEAFARYGYKRTTMADVAKAADMSRPAVYLRVSGKEELLRAVAAALLADALRTASAAAEDEKATTAGRLLGVLQAKLGLTLDLARRSEHAVELLEQYQVIEVDNATEEFMEAIRELCATVLAGAGTGEQRSKDLADALLHTVLGLELDLADPDRTQRLLHVLVDTVVAGLPPAA